MIPYALETLGMSKADLLDILIKQNDNDMFGAIIDQLQKDYAHELLNKEMYREAFQVMSQMKSDLYRVNYGIQMLDRLCNTEGYE